MGLGRLTPYAYRESRGIALHLLRRPSFLAPEGKLAVTTNFRRRLIYTGLYQQWVARGAAIEFCGPQSSCGRAIDGQGNSRLEPAAPRQS